MSKNRILKFWLLGLGSALYVVDAQAQKNLSNDFLWQAAVAKTSFMTNIKADKESGRIVAGWTEIDNKLYELNVRIMGEELLPDNVKVRVRERLRSEQGWSEPKVNNELTQATEEAIFDRARSLYNDSLN